MLRRFGCDERIKFARFLSYLHVGGVNPLLYKTVGKVLDEASEKFGDKTAIVSVHQNRRISFREAKEKAEKLASGLLNLGISPGDRVGLWSPNSLEWYIASLALAKAGFISVYLNPSYQSGELKHCLRSVGVKMLLAAESFKNYNYDKILEKIDPEITRGEPGNLKSTILPDLKWVAFISSKEYPGTISFDSIFEKSSEKSLKSLKKLEEKLSPDDASNIQFTSGTTGSAKGAVLSHFNIVNNSFLFTRRQELHLKDHVMCFMGPLFHAMGSVVAVLTCLHVGMPLVLPDSSFSASKSADAIVKEKCTVLLGTPTMYVDVLNVMKAKGLKPETPELAVSGGAYASTALFADMLSRLNVKRVASIYGLTETGPIDFMSRVTDDKEKQISTVGYIMEHVEAKVVDENGSIVPWNTPGELWVRGYNVMKGYWNDEKKTKEVITPEHWFKTGDQFVIGPDGYAKVVGRIKDLIIRGGENIHPADVEEFLSGHPDILEVQVVGISDERLGEQVCACIRLGPDSKLTEEDVREFCKGKIADYKIPYYVWFVETFPRTSSGKVQKFKLKILAENHFEKNQKSM